MFRFKCTSCNAWHEGMPTFAADAPLYFYSVPTEQRGSRCVLGSDTRVVDRKQFFVRGCLEIPVQGESDPFIWGVWVSISKERFGDFAACFDAPKRSHIGPFFGWLSAELPLYPTTENQDAPASAGQRCPPVYRIGAHRSSACHGAAKWNLRRSGGRDLRPL